ncbi:MAG: helix-turn-helix domain-containing protein [Planctomycetales bacterium]|nr:helix-turn-helix domain-containing protein [Planctomycetales bacterium]
MQTALAPRPAPLVDEKVASEILGLADGTLSVWRCTRRYPLPYTKIGRSVRYRVEDLERFIADRMVGGDAE